MVFQTSNPRGRLAHRRPVRLALSGVLAISAVLLAGCAGSGPGVVTSAATARVIAVTAGGPGPVAAATEVPILLGYRGTVTGVDVALGQRVPAGQLLLTVSSSGLNNEVGKAHLQLSADLKAQSDLKAATASAQQLAEAAAKVSLDQQQVAIALGQSRELRSPIAGRVSDLSVTAGAFVTSSVPLLRIVDATTVTVTAEMPVQYASEIHSGLPATVSLVGTPGGSLSGQVTGVSPSATTGGSTVKVVVTAPNPSGLALPGMSAYVDINLRVNAPVAVDSLAVLDQDTSPQVFVVNGGTVHQRSVVIGASDGTWTQVLSGLQPGDQVVVAGAQSLTDGTAVHVTQQVTPS